MIDNCKHLTKNSSFDSLREDNFKIPLEVLEAKKVASEGWINKCGKETDTSGRVWKSKVNLVQRIMNELHASTLPSSGERPLCSASSLWDLVHRGLSHSLPHLSLKEKLQGSNFLSVLQVRKLRTR